MSFREEYRNQVRLLLRVMPIVARETCFALKGGTAINLFIRNLPRLSVDIDLMYLPRHERPAALAEINAAMSRIKKGILAEIRGLSVTETVREGSVPRLPCGCWRHSGEGRGFPRLAREHLHPFDCEFMTDGFHLGPHLVAAADHPEHLRVRPRQSPAGDTAGCTGTQLTQPVGFDHHSGPAVSVVEDDQELDAPRTGVVRLVSVYAAGLPAGGQQVHHRPAEAQARAGQVDRAASCLVNHRSTYRLDRGRHVQPAVHLRFSYRSSRIHARV